MRPLRRPRTDGRLSSSKTMVLDNRHWSDNASPVALGAPQTLPREDSGTGRPVPCERVQGRRHRRHGHGRAQGQARWLEVPCGLRGARNAATTGCAQDAAKELEADAPAGDHRPQARRRHARRRRDPLHGRGPDLRRDHRGPGRRLRHGGLLPRHGRPTSAWRSPSPCATSGTRARLGPPRPGGRQAFDRRRRRQRQPGARPGARRLRRLRADDLRPRPRPYRRHARQVRRHPRLRDPARRRDLPPRGRARSAAPSSARPPTSPRPTGASTPSATSPAPSSRSTSSPPRSCRRSSPPASTRWSSTSRPAPAPSWRRCTTPARSPRRWSRSRPAPAARPAR